MIQFQDDIFRLRERIQKMEKETKVCNEAFENRIGQLEEQVVELQRQIQRLLPEEK